MRRYPSRFTNGRSIVNLLPGEVFCDREPRLVGTILGSCVSVCLWDRKLRFGGVNHHVLPVSPVNGDRSLRYGNVAVPDLIQLMIGFGSKLEDIQAKLFGGACVLSAGVGEYAVGQRNVEVALAELYRHAIPVVACRLAGSEGMVLLLCTDCGDVWVRSIRSVHGSMASLPLIRDLSELVTRFSLSLVPPGGGAPMTKRVAHSVASHQCPTCSMACMAATTP